MGASTALLAASAASLAATLCTVGLAPPLAPTAAPPAAVPLSPQQGRNPWFTQLGMRSVEVQAGLPVLDQVVLVPDAATYLDEVGRWSLQARWPVLIEDDAFAPRFVRAFKPAAVYRRASVLAAGTPAPTGDALKRRIEQAVVHAWNGADGATIIGAVQAQKVAPAGVVGASAADPAWTAAVALAAGHGQPIAWIDGDYATLGGLMSPQQFADLNAAVNAAFQATGLQWAALGDQLETFTLCRNSALRATIPNPPGGWNPRLPPRDAAPLAATDALCRGASGQRYAFAAQVPGDGMRAAYIAMCSLFLSRTSFWLFDGYAAKNDATFAEYGFTKLANVITEQTFKLEVVEGSNATGIGWRSMLPVGLDADVVFVNSAGNRDFFQIGASENLWSTQIPILNRPAALHMVHSFSLQIADQQDTIGWRWLEHGVYAYVGSVQEPFLLAFVPPRVVVQRALAFTPFLVASRQWEGDIIPQPWRVATLGDPLMVIPPNELLKHLVTRVPPAGAPAAELGYTDLRAVARQAMEATRTTPTAEQYATALRALVLLGDDKVAAQLWGIAAGKGQGALAAGDALGALFRTHSRDAFLGAWALAQKPSAEQKDMLWSLWAGQLNTTTPRTAVDALRDAVRKPSAHFDAEFLLPHVRRADGREAAAVWLNTLIDSEPSAEGKRKLAELQGKL